MANDPYEAMAAAAMMRAAEAAAIGGGVLPPDEWVRAARAAQDANGGNSSAIASPNGGDSEDLTEQFLLSIVELTKSVKYLEEEVGALTSAMTLLVSENAEMKAELEELKTGRPAKTIFQNTRSKELEGVPITSGVSYVDAQSAVNAPHIRLKELVGLKPNHWYRVDTDFQGKWRDGEFPNNSWGKYALIAVNPGKKVDGPEYIYGGNVSGKFIRFCEDGVHECSVGAGELLLLKVWA